tara:strand:- start:775 stop:975 length:201 start_codon:yes stop_codon:yes gene_type:complete
MKFLPSHKNTVEMVAENIRVNAYTTALMERFKGRASDLLEQFSATEGAETVKDHLFKVYNSLDELT